MKKLPLLLFGLLVFSSMFSADHIISYKLYQTITREQFRATMKKRHLPKSMVPARYTVDIYDITYYTKWHDGSTIKATGLYYVPRNEKGAMPELVYHHGTRVNKGRGEKLGGEENICLGLAMDGYLVLEPDYIGLGNGDKFHLYQLAASEGQASVDMLFAIKELNDTLRIKDDGMLFLTGYSQGGHATLATQKLIQDNYATQFHVTASSPMSGAYDMCGAQSKVMFQPYSHPFYLPYLLRSYNEAYNTVGPNVNVAYKHPYDSIVPLLFDGKHNIGEINRQLPAIPGDMVTDSFINQYKTNPNFPLRVELKENSLCDWKPEAPVQLCYCDSDEQVSPENAFVAYKTMKSNGAAHVTLRKAGKNFKHSRCAIVAILYTEMYFDTFCHGSKYGGKGAVRKRIVANIVKMVVKKNSKKHSGDRDGREGGNRTKS
jgi:hypothetical protein